MIYPKPCLAKRSIRRAVLCKIDEYHNCLEVYLQLWCVGVSFDRGESLPDFRNPFDVLKNNRLLTHEELVRSIRFMVAAEFEATQLYEQ